MSKPQAASDSAKWRQLALLALVQFLAMTLWFSASAVTRALQSEWSLSGGAVAWLTISVQLGFVIGALASSVLNLSDRFPQPRLMAIGALVGAATNLAIPLGVPESLGRTTGGFALVIALRMLTGVMLAAVYPTGMKLMATWFARGRGLAIGILVGALTLGSASPHLLNAFASGGSDWRMVMTISSICATAAGVLALLFVQTGPNLPSAARFDWSYFARVWADPALRRANFGYLGHMFELYAMWAWAPQLLAESFQREKLSSSSASLAGFATVAIGGLGCVLAGAWADRIGRTWTTIVSLVISGSCALVAGHLVGQPYWLLAVCLLWGFSVVADSAQFSAAISELCDPRYVGTALTIQTCAGFLLTTLTIRAVPAVREHFDWPLAMSLLALGPLFGIWHMARLRTLPAALKMAGGQR